MISEEIFYGRYPLNQRPLDMIFMKSVLKITSIIILLRIITIIITIIPITITTIMRL